MKTYQLFFLVSPKIQELEAEDLKIELEGFLKEMGDLKTAEPTKRIRLAYPVKKHTEAFFNSFIFETEAKKIGEIKTKIESETKIIRYLIIQEDPTKKVEEKIVLPKPEAQKEEPIITKKKTEPKADLKNLDAELDKALNE